MVVELPFVELDGYKATVDNRLRQVRIVREIEPRMIIFIPFEKLEKIYLETSLPQEFLARRILKEKVL